MPNDFLSQIQSDLAEADRTRSLNKNLFTLIAPQYDAATRCLSLGRDSSWKDKLVAGLPDRSTPVCLDLASGTGDVTRRLAERFPTGSVIGLDLTDAMLDQARQIPTSSHDIPQPCYIVGDMGHTGIASNSVDIVTGSYALRNAGDLNEAIQEVYRILKPGGVAVFLDFSKPAQPSLQQLSHTILKLWGSLWGWILHRDPRVYAYIADSLARYPDRQRLSAQFQEAGFETAGTRYAFLGLIECRSVKKPGLHNPQGSA